MHCQRIALLLATIGALIAGLAIAPTASATIVVIEYTDRNGVGGFPNNGGPLWTGYVDTEADALTIQTWNELPGTPEFWSPKLSSLPLVWPAVSSTGAPYDVPDNFAGDIDSSFAFISAVSAQNMLWEEGLWGRSGGISFPGSDFYPGWGGVRLPANVNGVLTFVYHTSADETAMPLLPIAPLGLAASTDALVSVHIAANADGTAVPETSAFLFGLAACGAAVGVACWRRAVGALRSIRLEDLSIRPMA